MISNEEFEQIFAFLGAIRPLSEECKAYLRRVIQYKKIAKKEILLKIGETNIELFLIKKGCLKCYHYHKEKEICDWFFFERSTVVSTGSFYRRLPSKQVIEGVEDTELYYITQEDYEYLKWNFGDFCYIATILLEKYITIFDEHAQLIRDKRPFEKFQEMHENMPEIMLRVDGKDIATWLNMRPETFSRKKKQWMKDMKKAGNVAA